MNNGKQFNVNVDFKQTTPVKCDECSSELFINAVMVRKAPKLLVGTPEDLLIPIPVFVCQKCGHLNEGLKPKITHETKA